MRNKKDYDQQYYKDHIKRISFNLNTEKDKDILAYLDKHKPVQTELKRLIREEIKRSE